MDEILVSDIMGVFNRNDRFIVRVRRPDFTFIEGEISPEDVTGFSARWKRAQETDDDTVFDVSMVTDWVTAD
jgi:hypothetical protein